MGRLWSFKRLSGLVFFNHLRSVFGSEGVGFVGPPVRHTVSRRFYLPDFGIEGGFS